MSTKESNKFINSSHDSINSKFKHRIIIPNKNIVLTGYSGKVGMRERDNEIDNFINYTLRLMKSNYYPGSTREIENVFYYLNREDELITTFHRGFARWEPKFLFDQKWTKARNVIDTMFELLEKKCSPEQIDDRLRIKTRALVVFDPTDLTAKFTNESALTKYCNELLRKGYSQGEVENYFRNYRTRHFKA